MIIGKVLGFGVSGYIWWLLRTCGSGLYEGLDVVHYGWIGA